MRISKVLAAASAAALVASMGMTFVSADTTYTATTIKVTDKDDNTISNKELASYGSLWTKSYDAALKDADMSKLAIHFVVETDGKYDAGQKAFTVYGFNSDNNNKEDYMAVAGQTKYDFYHSLKDVKLDQWGGFGFNAQAGARDVKIISVDVVTVGESAPSSSTADSSTVAGDSSKADVTSSAAAGDSSKADDTSKPADGTKVDPMTLKAYLGTGSVPLIDEKDEKDESIIKAKGVLNDTGVAYTDVYGFTVNVTFGKDANAIIEKAGWLGGGMGINAKSCGWSQKEWSLQEGAKDVTGVKAEDGSYNFTLTLDKAAFVDTDKYAQVWFQNWTTKGDTINAVTLLGKDGKALATVTNDPSLAPKDDKKDDEKKDDTKKDDEKKDDNKGSSSVADGSSTTSTTSTNSTGTTSSKAANNASNTNPSTGAAALAAVGVALAGAAVVATKKRK
ncbi:NPXTG-anchored protein [uncultured Ruminococcus sp.]|uniref:NPXTG-anchored protein n=1 Tax=uncultured Ruminococcus sp. TaxID=165186 RepID=UPI002622391C|nr:NPXTG-anchored protein [uncultured Ruminococcus sp.]